MLEILKGPILAIQDFYLLTGRALRNLGRKPHHGDDIKLQMDALGFGAIPIVVLTGAFSGAVMALQMGRALQQYGQTGRTGTVVSIILVRELGPVLASLMVAGRNASGIASELGSMKVTGADRRDAGAWHGSAMQKLVTPRMLAMAIMLPCLTVIDDFVGMAGGWIIGKLIYDLDFLQVLVADVAGAGLERRCARSPEALYFFFRDLPDRMLLRSASVRRNTRRRAGPRLRLWSRPLSPSS